MSLLTDREIEELYFTEIDNRIGSFAHAIEAAVVAKLATVNVEPCAWEVETEQQDGTGAKWVSTDRKRHREFCDFGEPRQLYSQEAIAAARVQGIEEAAKVCAKQLSPLESADRSWNAATRSCIRHINNLTDSYETSLQTPSSDQSKAQGLS